MKRGQSVEVGPVIEFPLGEEEKGDRLLFNVYSCIDFDPVSDDLMHSIKILATPKLPFP